jgi:starch synthase
LNVAVGCHGRYHLFDLARQIEQRGYLGRLYTGYPRFKVEHLPRHKVSTFPWLMAPYMAAGRFIGIGTRLEMLEPLIIRSFDDWVARNLEPYDIYHCLSASGIRTHETARRNYGTISICDRPCAHIIYQERILREEYDRQGVHFNGINPSVKQRELQEYDSCDLIAVPSTFAYRSFIELGIPSAKLRINPLGADLQTFKPIAKKDDIFRVIYTGALSFQKGVLYLLEALCGLRLSKFEIWLIGYVRDEMVPVLARYEGRFRFLGTIDRHQLHRFYSQGSVFVLASVHDGFGMVQAEAMACGLPVISTMNTGAPDLFTDGVEGFIVPIRSPDAIRQKVLLLYDHPELQAEMSKAALRRMAEIGGWREYGDRTVRLYEEALAGRTGLPRTLAAG